MNVEGISAVTLFVKDMEKSCSFYSTLPGFKLKYGGSMNDSFTTFEIGLNPANITYLNLDLFVDIDYQKHKREHCGRVIFHTDDVDEMYTYLHDNKRIAKLISFSGEPVDAPWGERYFHVLDPDGYIISFAKPIKGNN